MAFKILSFLLLTLSHPSLAAHPSPLTPLLPRVPSPTQVPTPARRGLAFTDPRFIQFFEADNSYVTWTYNYDSERPDYASWYVYVPMLYSLRAVHTESWRSRSERAVRAANDAKRPIWFMGWCEPDVCLPGAGGTCIRVPDAVTGWKQYMDPLKDLKNDLYLVSPAVSNADASDNMGLRWLKKFLDACTGCSIDVMAVHWYGHADDFAGFKKYIIDVRSIVQNRPIWVTEFRASGTDNVVKMFLHDAMTWMDAQDDVHRYAYFMVRSGPGMLVNDEQDGLSELGTFYNMHGG